VMLVLVAHQIPKASKRTRHQPRFLSCHMTRWHVSPVLRRKSLRSISRGGHKYGLRGCMKASQPAASAVMHDWTERHPNRIYGTRRSHARWQRAANCASCVLTTVHHSCRVSSWLQSSWRPVVRARRQGQSGLFSWYVIGGLLDA
jgi:hypothetical protein